MEESVKEKWIIGKALLKEALIKLSLPLKRPKNYSIAKVLI